MTRHVIKAEEVCQAWVRQTKGYAHTPSRNLSFTSFYRLLSHNTAIAGRLRTASVTAPDVIFVTKHNYSATTAKQLRDLRDALFNTHALVIYVPGNVPTYRQTLPTIWTDMIKEAQGLWAKALRARSRKDELTAEANSIIKQANQMVELFDLSASDGIPQATYDSVNDDLKFYEAHIRLRA